MKVRASSSVRAAAWVLARYGGAAAIVVGLIGALAWHLVRRGEEFRAERALPGDFVIARNTSGDRRLAGTWGVTKVEGLQPPALIGESGAQEPGYWYARRVAVIAGRVILVGERQRDGRWDPIVVELTTQDGRAVILKDVDAAEARIEELRKTDPGGGWVDPATLPRAPRRKGGASAD